MNAIVLILALIYTFALGFSLVTYFFQSLNMQIKIGISFGLGVGIVYLQLFLYSIVGISWSLASFLIPGIIVIILLSKNRRPKLQLNKPNILVLLIIGICLYVAFESISRPLIAWDGWATWLFRSKIFFIENSVKPTSLMYSGSDYPLVISLYISFLYKLIGSVNDKIVLLSYPSFFASLILVFYGATKEYVGEKKALFFCILLALLQNVIRHSGYLEAGMADLPLAYFFLVDFVLLVTLVRKPNYRLMLLLQFLLGITALVKNEGVPYSIIMELYLVYTLIRYKYFKVMGFIVVFILLYLSWEIYKNWYGIHLNDLINRRTFDFFRIPAIVKGFVIEMFNIKNWNLLWVAFVFAVGSTLMSWKATKVKLVYIFIFMQLMVYEIIFLITPIDVSVHIHNVIDRLFLHVAPLVLFAITVQFASKQSRSSKK